MTKIHEISYEMAHKIVEILIRNQWTTSFKNKNYDRISEEKLVKFGQSFGWKVLIKIVMKNWWNLVKVLAECSDQNFDERIKIDNMNNVKSDVWNVTLSMNLRRKIEDFIGIVRKVRVRDLCGTSWKIFSVVTN